MCTKNFSYEIFSPQFWGLCTKFFSVRNFLGLQYIFPQSCSAILFRKLASPFFWCVTETHTVHDSEWTCLVKGKTSVLRFVTRFSSSHKIYLQYLTILASKKSLLLKSFATQTLKINSLKRSDINDRKIAQNRTSICQFKNKIQERAFLGYMLIIK